MRAVLVTWDGGGNLPPMLGIGQELRRRGWAVDVLGHQSHRARVEAAGLTFVPVTRGHEYESASPRNTLRAAWMMSAAFADRGRGLDAVAAARSDHDVPSADLFVVDCLLWGALAECRKSGIPVVSVVHSLWQYFSAVPTGPVGQLSRLRGVDAVSAFRDVDLTVVTTRADWEPLDAPPLPERVRHTGIVWQGTPVPAQPDPIRPRVLISLSSTAFPGQLQVLQRVLDAASRLPVQLVVTTGPSIDPAQLRRPVAPEAPADVPSLDQADIQVHQYLDHADLLPTTSLVIGHGGHATTARALAYGIPLLILPMHPMLDQHLVGQAVERLGAGRCLKRAASTDQLQRAIHELSTDPAVTAAAESIGEQIRRRDGAVTAADAIVALIGA